MTPEPNQSLHLTGPVTLFSRDLKFFAGAPARAAFTAAPKVSPPTPKFVRVTS